MSAEQRVEAEFPVRRRTDKRVANSNVVCAGRLTVEPSDRRFVLRSVQVPANRCRAPADETFTGLLRSLRPA